MAKPPAKPKKQTTIHGTYAGDGQITGPRLPIPEGTPVRAKVSYQLDLAQSGGRTEEVVLPEIGNCRVPFYGLASDVLEWLDSTGAVEFLKNTPQLGPVSRLQPHFKHSRWDYVCLICHLVDVVGRRSREYQLGVASKITVPSQPLVRFSSGIELLQTWALLSNAGHLRDTFTAESVLRHTLRSKNLYFENFISLFRHQWAQRLAGVILREESDYRFYLALALLNLEALPPYDRRYKLFGVALASYISAAPVPGLTSEFPPVIEYLRRVYRQIRTLAFTALDSHYSGSAVGVSVSRLVQDIVPLIGDSHSDDSVLQANLADSVANYYTSTCYCSPEMVLLNHLHRRKLRARVTRALKKLRNKSETLERLRNWRDTGFGFSHGTRDWQHVSRFHVELQKAPHVILQRLFPRRRNEDQVGVMALLTYGGHGGACYLDVYSKPLPGASTAALRTVARLGHTQVLRRRFSELGLQYADVGEPSELVFRRRDSAIRPHAKNLREYVRFVLDRLAGAGIRTSFQDDRRGPANRWFYGRTRTGILKDLECFEHEFAEDLKRVMNTEELAVRRTELAFLRHVLRRCHPGLRNTLAFTGSVSIYNPDHGELTDVDGIALVHGRGETRLLLLQSKETHRSRIGAARRWARDVLVSRCFPYAKGNYRVHTYKRKGLLVSVAL